MHFVVDAIRHREQADDLDRRVRAAQGDRWTLPQQSVLHRPDDEVGQQAFAVIREAIRQEGMVAIGKVVFTSREHVIALEARGNGMIAGGDVRRGPCPENRQIECAVIRLVGDPRAGEPGPGRRELLTRPEVAPTTEKAVLESIQAMSLLTIMEIVGPVLL